MFLADGVAVMAIDQKITPQDQRIAASFGEQAAFERGELILREWIDVGAEVFVDGDCHSGKNINRKRDSVHSVVRFSQCLW